MSKHRFNSSRDASLDITKCGVGSSMNRATISCMFTLLSLIAQLINDILNPVFGCMQHKTSKAIWKSQALT